jgi:spermidine synthase
MKRREPLRTATTPDGEPVTLWQDGDGFVVRVRREVLITSRQHGSEAAMIEAALEQVPEPTQVLVAGLGMGFTLRAALDRLPPTSHLTVVEIVPEIVEWNQGLLAHLAGHPLDDPRVSVAVDDLSRLVSREPARFHVMLLDIDNGPEAFTVASNDHVYGDAGLTALSRALVDGGVLVVWSAFQSRDFERRLARNGFHAHSKMVRARGAVAKGARHWLYVAVKAGSGG